MTTTTIWPATKQRSVYVLTFFVLFLVRFVIYLGRKNDLATTPSTFSIGVVFSLINKKENKVMITNTENK